MRTPNARSRARHEKRSSGSGPALAALTLCGVWLALPLATHAQPRDSFRIDRAPPAPTAEDGLTIPHPRTLGDLRPGFLLVLDYAYQPLRAQLRGGAPGSIVEHRPRAHVHAALGITDRLEVHLRVPFALGFSGTALPDLPAVETFSMGDGAIGASVRAVGEGDDDGLWLGISAELLVPLGTPNGFASDLEVGARGLVTVAYGLPLMTAYVALGAAYRPERALENARIGSELEFALGVEFGGTPWLDVFFELVGSSLLRLDDRAAEPAFFNARGTPLELLAGARATTELGVSIELGGSIGLTSAVGVPTARAFLGVAFVPPPSGPGDRDGDGLSNDDDTCPELAEDADGFSDGDGCPEADNDDDGVLDADDACPITPEDHDGFSDEDGCPDEDDDGDGIADDRDHCPRAPGPDWARGCPQTIRLAETEIQLLRPIDFEPGAATILPSSNVSIGEIAETIELDPRMRVRISVRARAEQPAGRRGRRADLGRARAEALAAALIARGAPADRIEHEGLPPREPGSSPETSADAVTITIVERTPEPERGRTR